MKKLLLCVSASMVLLSMASPSYALFGDDEARKAILELRGLVQSQQEAQVRLYDRVESLNNEVKQLRGELDELRNNLGRQIQATQEEVQTQQNQKNDAENAKKIAAQDREIAAKQAFDAALAQFNSKKYDSAIKQLTAFGQKYKSSKLYPESQYWLASAYYAKGNTAKAISVGNSMANGYPKNAKAPEALLIVGMAQLDSNKAGEAKATFNKIVKNYPKSSAAKIASQQ